MLVSRSWDLRGMDHHRFLTIARVCFLALPNTASLDAGRISQRTLGYMMTMPGDTWDIWPTSKHWISGYSVSRNCDKTFPIDKTWTSAKNEFAVEGSKGVVECMYG